MKKTFQLYTDYRGMIDALPDEQAGQLIKAIFAHEAGEKVLLEGALDSIRILVTNQLDRDREKYEYVCEQNRQNISKRWNKTKLIEYERIQPIEYERVQTDNSSRMDIVPEKNALLDKDAAPKLNRFIKEDSKKKNSNASWLMEIFDAFWKVYPKRSNKPDAVRAFIELNPDQLLFDQMIEEIEAQKLSLEWKEGNGRHIPLPAKWLRDHRQTDVTGDI